jgi:hypothetical protein
VVRRPLSPVGCTFCVSSLPASSPRTAVVPRFQVDRRAGRPRRARRCAGAPLLLFLILRLYFKQTGGASSCGELVFCVASFYYRCLAGGDRSGRLLSRFALSQTGARTGAVACGGDSVLFSSA